MIVKDAAYYRNWRLRNGEKRRAYERARYRDLFDPLRERDRWLRRTYGITAEQWEALFDAQGRVCALCKGTDPKNKWGWHTDHEHRTGRIRGILCNPCNVLVGKLGDTYEEIEAHSKRILEYVR